MLLQTSSLSARLFYLGLEPKRQKQWGKDVGKLGRLKLIRNGIYFVDIFMNSEPFPSLEVPSICGVMFGDKCRVVPQSSVLGETDNMVVSQLPPQALHGQENTRHLR